MSERAGCTSQQPPRGAHSLSGEVGEVLDTLSHLLQGRASYGLMYDYCLWLLLCCEVVLSWRRPTLSISVKSL